MLEIILSLFGGGLLGKIHNALAKKVEPVSSPYTANYNMQSNEDNKAKDIQDDSQKDTNAPVKNTDLWQDTSMIAKLANFIVFTTRSILAYLFFWLLIFIIGCVIINKDSITEHEWELFHIILTKIFPSVIGYWFIRFTINSDTFGSTIKTIKNYIKR